MAPAHASVRDPCPIGTCLSSWQALESDSLLSRLTPPPLKLPPWSWLVQLPNGTLNLGTKCHAWYARGVWLLLSVCLKKRSTFCLPWESQSWILNNPKVPIICIRIQTSPSRKAGWPSAKDSRVHAWPQLLLYTSGACQSRGFPTLWPALKRLLCPHCHPAQEYTRERAPQPSPVLSGWRLQRPFPALCLVAFRLGCAFSTLWITVFCGKTTYWKLPPNWSLCLRHPSSIML